MAYMTKATAQLMRDLGSIQSPQNAFLLNLGLETLHLRMPRHCENAQKVAEWLEANPQVAWVNYCGLKSSKYYELTQKYMPNGSCGVIAFGLKGSREEAIKFMDSLKLACIVTHVADLMIPTLQVNPITNSISTTDGGNVQLAINGRKATQNEVMALQPSEILRVELEEDPGVRYDNAAMVINYVVRRYEMGGSFGYNGQQSIKSLFGRHNANGKLNFGNSEISFFYHANQQIFDEMWSVRNETFNFEDGSALSSTRFISAAANGLQKK